MLSLKGYSVILLFTEGLSMNVIHDDRDIMPNVASFEAISVGFSNYYNHTFATYMGILGQLYSGYQQSNYDSCGLPSLQYMLREAGYRTYFFNVEPRNKEFSRYIDSMGFDEVISSELLNGPIRTVSDKDFYDGLLPLAVSLHNQESPFFLAAYTFGTHASLDSTDIAFGDASDPLLNKFHNLDAQFGRFLDAFDACPLMDDVLLVFTADHATYDDSDFKRAFPGYARFSGICDTIPLMFYHRGISPAVHDCGGRNSLDLAPTLLDALAVPVGQNFFLGSSLFEGPSDMDTFFCSLSTCLRTEHGTVRGLHDDERQWFCRELLLYYRLRHASGMGSARWR